MHMWPGTENHNIDYYLTEHLTCAANAESPKQAHAFKLRDNVSKGDYEN